LIQLMPAPAVEMPVIRQAIDKGVQALKRMPIDRDARVGAWALAGLTLLECGTSEMDPVILHAAELLRKKSVSLTGTYDLSLTLMFMDRLGDPRDVELIQSMGVRLLGGQNAAGGWGYECPANGPEEERRLTEIVEKRTELRGTRDAPKAARAPQERPVLPKEIQAQLDRFAKGEAVIVNDPNRFRMGDNSNTQFAILGLWVARRHGVPVEAALGGVEQRFRKSQNGDGGWGYLPDQSSTATMTCAGLLGLAVGHGVANETVLRTAPAATETKPLKKSKTNLGDPSKDPAVRAGLLALATAIGHPAAKTKGMPPIIRRGFRNRIYYFFWSLERVAVAYDLKTIGNKDWYAWGSEILVASQGMDGTWDGDYGPQIDTCFALLFLQRANLASDLTANLKGKTRDPGEVTLRSGGVGGQQLSGKGTAPGFDILRKPSSGVPPDSGSTSAPSSRDQPTRSSPDPPENDWTKEAARLSEQLIRATGPQQEKIIEEYQKAKGPAYTKAMALAIPQISGGSRTKVRDALAERLMRMTASTLREKLKDQDPEIRYAGARACASKEETEHIPDLIGLLDDPAPQVMRAARAGLKHLSGGKDFGPKSDASASDKAQAIAEWKKWWGNRGSGRPLP